MSDNPLLHPIHIGALELKNRIALAPMDTELTAPDGSVTDRYVAFLRERARGGAGLLFTEFSAIDQDQMMSSLGSYSGRLKAGLNRLVEAVEPYGSRVFLQLAHHGGQALTALTGRRPVAPSEIECPLYTHRPRALTEDEIETLIERFVDAAVRASEAGFHGVEVHGAYDYLIGQFTSPACNQRSDRFGGSFENRMRFAGSIIEGIRRRCGAAYPIGFKFNIYEELPRGLTLEDGIIIARWAEEQGVVYAHVAVTAARANLTHLSTLYSDNKELEAMTATIRKALHIPVIATACARRPEDARRLLDESTADIVAVGRGFLADPSWANKTGDTAALRPCILCNRCHQRIMTSRTIHCTVNPHLGEDEGKEVVRTSSSKTVVVVGAGPAGVSASLSAEARGHRVHLYEREQRIGGNLVAAAHHAFKGPMRELLFFYEREIARSKIELTLGAVPSTETILTLSPDVIVVATGGRPFVPPIPGTNLDNVLSPTDQKVLDGQIPKEVIVAGAGLVGLETALHLSHAGCQVTVIDTITQEQVLSTEATYVKSHLLERLEETGTELRCGLRITGITRGGLTCSDRTGAERTLACEAIVLALGYVPADEMTQKLREAFPHTGVIPIGDCRNVGNLYTAIQHGHQVGCTV